MMFLLSSGRCSSINTSQIVRKTTAIAPANKPQQLYDIGRVGLIPDPSDYKWSRPDRLKTGHRHSWLSLASELGRLRNAPVFFFSPRNNWQCRSGLSWLNARQTPVVHSGLHASAGQIGPLPGTDRGSPLSVKILLLVVTRTRLTTQELSFLKFDEGAEHLGD